MYDVASVIRLALHGGGGGGGDAREAGGGGRKAARGGGGGRGLHSFTSQLNLSRFGHTFSRPPV
jgi:hypothetical protein